MRSFREQTVTNEAGLKITLAPLDGHPESLWLEIIPVGSSGLEPLIGFRMNVVDAEELIRKLQCWVDFENQSCVCPACDGRAMGWPKVGCSLCRGTGHLDRAAIRRNERRGKKNEI